MNTEICALLHPFELSIYGIRKRPVASHPFPHFSSSFDYFRYGRFQVIKNGKLTRVLAKGLCEDNRSTLYFFSVIVFDFNFSLDIDFKIFVEQFLALKNVFSNAFFNLDSRF